MEGSKKSAKESQVSLTTLTLSPEADTPISILTMKSPLFTAHLSKILNGKTFGKEEKSISFELFAVKSSFGVVSFEPKEVPESSVLKISNKTKLIIQIHQETAEEIKKEVKPKKYFEVGTALEELLSTIAIHQKEQSAFPLSGILLSGEKGSGKSELMAQAIQKLESVETTSLQISELRSRLPHLASAAQKGVIFIDTLRGVEGDALEAIDALFRLVQTQRALVVMAVRKDEVKNLQNLLTAGKFEKIIELDQPSIRERALIARHLLSEMSSSLEQTTGKAGEGAEVEAVCDMVVLRTPGHSFHDLVCLFRELEAFHLKTGEAVSVESCRRGLASVSTALLRDLRHGIEKVFFRQIGGYEIAKRRIRAVVELPLSKPEIFARRGVRPSTGVLLYGPPGCSKTMFARAIATESNFTFISVKGPEVFTKYVGDSEQKIREIFRKARLCAPSVVFFDEIDSIATRRDNKSDVGDRVLTQLLTEMDGVDTYRESPSSSSSSSSNPGLSDHLQNLVVVVAATNRPDILDPAVLRPGRLDELVYVPLPDLQARRDILKISTSKMPLSSNIDIEKLAESTQGFSGAEIVLLCREAALQGVYNSADSEQVTQEDFTHALTQISPRITQRDIQGFEAFAKNAKKL